MLYTLQTDTQTSAEDSIVAWPVAGHLLRLPDPLLDTTLRCTYIIAVETIPCCCPPLYIEQYETTSLCKKSKTIVTIDYVQCSGASQGLVHRRG